MLVSVTASRRTDAALLLRRETTPSEAPMRSRKRPRAAIAARRLFPHCWDDPTMDDLRCPFLLGRDLIVAPAVDKDAGRV